MWSRLVTLEQCIAYLTRILDAREADVPERYVIVEVGKTNHYVQFYFDEDAIYGEAVGSHYLTGDGWPALTAQQEEMLAFLGWDGPGDPAAREDGGDGHGNFHRQWSYDTTTDTIVMDIMRTLVAVYAAGEGEQLELHRSWYEPGDWVNRIPA